MSETDNETYQTQYNIFVASYFVGNSFGEYGVRAISLARFFSRY